MQWILLKLLTLQTKPFQCRLKKAPVITSMIRRGFPPTTPTWSNHSWAGMTARGIWALNTRYLRWQDKHSLSRWRYFLVSSNKFHKNTNARALQLVAEVISFCVIFQIYLKAWSWMKSIWRKTELRGRRQEQQATGVFWGHFDFHEFWPLIRDPKCFNIKCFLQKSYAPFLRYGTADTPFLPKMNIFW